MEHKHTLKAIFETNFLEGEERIMPDEYSKFSTSDTALGDEHDTIVKCQDETCNRMFLVRNPLNESIMKGGE